MPGFEEHSLELIDLPLVLESLAGMTQTHAGRRAARRLRPLESPAAARRRLVLIVEIQQRLELGDPLPLSGLEDLTPLLKRLGSPLSSLPRTELWQLYYLTLIVAGLRGLELEEEFYPGLRAFLDGLRDLDDLRERFEAVFSPQGEIRDDASPELRRLLRERKSLDERLRDRLERLLGKAAEDGAVHERLVTRRDGRFVLPVLRDFRGSMPGIVHGQSKSGTTLYVEPLELVDANNELAALGYAVEAEIARILAELSSEAARRRESLAHDYRLVGELDLLQACARLARRLQARPVELTADGATLLRAARHPVLLLNRGDSASVVPIDIELGGEYQVLLITGPNAGGKTVALKTLGLLTVLAQCGLPLPVDDGSRVAWRDSLLADIGDEQSVAGDLSTFSYHVRRLGEILTAVDQSGGAVLVLLDEIGTGTDPDQGAALAMATLERLRSAGAWVLATSHYDSLKGFVYGAEGMENAAVDFDPHTLEPLYRLSTGTPGASNTLAMARNLGLDADLVEKAHEFLDDEYLRLDRLVEELEEERRRRREAERARRESIEELIRVRRETADRVAEIEAGKTEKLLRIKRELQNELELAEAETAAAAERLRKTERAPTDAGLSAARNRLKRQREELRNLEKPPPRPEKPVRQPDREMRVGDRVRLEGAKNAADLLELHADEAVIALGAMKMTVPRDKLTPVAERGTQPDASLDNLSLADRHVGPELMLRGMRVEEALEKLDKYLDDAALSGHTTVRIVHGKGTGALRFAVLEFLEGHRHVEAVTTPEHRFGGTGVTEVTLC